MTTDRRPTGWMMMGSALTVGCWAALDWATGQSPLPALGMLAGVMCASIFWVGVLIVSE